MVKTPNITLRSIELDKARARGAPASWAHTASVSQRQSSAALLCILTRQRIRRP